MKRIITFILCAVMVIISTVFAASAAGTLVFSDDFTTGFPPRNWIHGAFAWDSVNECVHGYSDAVVLQPQFNAPYNNKWDDFYVSYDFQVRADDDKGDGNPTSIGLWYCDTFNNDETNGAVYEFTVCVQTGEALLTKTHTYSYKDSNDISQTHSMNKAPIAGPVALDIDIEVGEDAPWYNIGMRVTDGVMQCYYGEELVFDLAADPDDEKIGGISQTGIDATVGSMETPVIILNMGNWLAVDNYKVWTADYDFKIDILYGDVDGNDTVNLLDASAIMKYAAGWTSVELVEQVADVDGSGSVNLLDVSLVMKYVAKWDVTLGPVE